MDRASDLASVRRVSAPCLRIIGAVHKRDIALFILFAGGAGHEVGVHEADLIARIQTAVLADRYLHEIVPVDIDLSRERNLSASEFRIFQVILDLELLCLPFRIVVDHQLQRIKNRHDAGPLQLQVLAEAVLQHRVIRRGLRLGDAGQFHKHTDRFGGIASAPQAGNGNKARIIPAVHNAVLDQLFDIAFSRDDVGQVHLGKFDLPGRMRIFQLLHNPVVQRPVILELQRADRVGYALDRVFDRMREIVHGINAPLVSGILMRHMGDTVDDRITHIHIGRSHVDLRAQNLCAVLVQAVLHILEEFQVFLHGTVPVRTVLAGFRQSPAVLPDLLGSQVADKSLAFADQLYGSFIHLIKIIGGEEKAVLIIRAEPFDVILDRFDKFTLFLGRVRVIETQVELAVVFLRQAVIEQNRLRVSDMQITVRLRRETGHNLLCPSLLEISVNNLFDKILSLCFHNNLCSLFSGV